MSTLYELVKAIPDFAGRVYLGSTDDNQAPLAPYAIVDEIDGGPIGNYLGTAAVAAVYPEVTVYCKPGVGQVPAQAYAQVNALIDTILATLPSLTADTFGRSYTPGSVQRANEPRPIADSKVPGQRFACIKFRAELYRR